MSRDLQSTDRVKVVLIDPDGSHEVEMTVAQVVALADASAAVAAGISDTAYNATTWNGVTDVAPSKNAVRDKIESMPTGAMVAGCKLYHSVDQTFASALDGAIAFDHEVFDVGGMHDNVTNNSRITIVTAGYYLLYGAIRIGAAAAPGLMVYGFHKNGGSSGNDLLADTGFNLNDTTYGPTLGFMPPVMTVVHLVATDFVELFMYQQTSNDLIVQADNIRSPQFSAVYLGS
jgi:hypothetical protein